MSRPHLTAAEYGGRLHALLRGERDELYTDPHDLLSDVLLASMNETGRQRDRAESAERRGEDAIAAVQRLWPLVFSAGKRLTMRTAEVRAALEGREEAS